MDRSVELQEQPTYFLPAEQEPVEELNKLRNRILSWHPLQEAMEACQEGIVLLNEHRQIIYSNPAFSHYANSDQPLTGQRFGDVLSCIQLSRTPGGCGTGYACRNCQIANGIFSALKWTGSQFRSLVHVTTEGPQEVPVRARLESVIVGNRRLLFCRVSAHSGHPSPVHDFTHANPELLEICNLLISGGPFCPY